MADSPEEIQKHIKTYLMVGAALFAFTVITVVVSWFHFGSMEMNYAIGLGIACFKASLVALIFMHLNSEKKLIYKILLFTVIFVIGLAFLTLLAGGDPLMDYEMKGGYQEEGVQTKY